jgi:hypothetical protein
MFSLISSGSRRSMDCWIVVSAIWTVAPFVAYDVRRED